MRSAILVALASLSTMPCRAMTEDRTGFGYCAPPNPPSCIDADVTYRDTKQLKACKEAVRHYVDSVAKYRTCLSRETERAILEVNAKLDRYKCRSQPGGPSCPRK